MDIRTFEAGSMVEALEMISAAMGPDAVILAVQELPGEGPFDREGFGICVTAGRDGGTSTHRSRRGSAGGAVGTLEREKASIESEIVARLSSNGVPPGVSRRWAVRALDQAHRVGRPSLNEVMDRLLQLVSRSLQAGVGGHRRDSSVSVVVGPCGAGKTTSVVKLALREVRAGRDVRVVSLDEGDPSAEMLSIYARTTGLSCLRARSVETVRALAENAGLDDRIFVDTEGRSPSQLTRIQELSRQLHALGKVALHLVLPATMAVPDMLSLARAFAPFRYSGLLFTHFDEATCIGGSVAVAIDLGVPISFLGTGPDVRTDVVVADPHSLACMVGAA